MLKIVDGIKVIADKHGATPGQVALAWVLAQGDDILPIPGSTKPAVRLSHSRRVRFQSSTDDTAVWLQNIRENMDAAKVQLLAEEVDAVRKLAENADATIGPRYPPSRAHLVGIDTPPLE